MDFNDRWINWHHIIPSAIIDTFTVDICQPIQQSWQYRYERNRFGIKYEIVCSIGVPKIIWASGPWRGLASDPTIAKKSGIKRHLHQSEALLSDKIYRGDTYSFITAFSGHRYSLNPEQRKFNYLIYSARSAIERVIRRVTVFGIFQNTWKFTIDLHKKCARCVFKLVNFVLLYEPLG